MYIKPRQILTPDQIEHLKTQSPLLKLLAENLQWSQEQLLNTQRQRDTAQTNYRIMKDSREQAESIAVLLAKPQDCPNCGVRNPGITTHETRSIVRDDVLDEFKQLSSTESARRAAIVAEGAGFSFEDAGNVSIVRER